MTRVGVVSDTVAELNAVAEASASIFGPVAAGLTATVNGPAVALGDTPFEATTEYEKLVVPVVGVPETLPVVELIDKNEGAPVPSA